MKKFIAVLVAGCFLFFDTGFAQNRFPADRAIGVNPDTHLVLTFPSTPTLGKSGQIRIYDAADNKLVDTLDLSIPPRPHGGCRRPGGTVHADAL
jgi:hypothetical protein